MLVIEGSMEQRRNERAAGGGEIPERTRRPTTSSGTIPTCQNPESLKRSSSVDVAARVQWVPGRSLVSGRNAYSFSELHSGYWLLLRAPSGYSTEQAPDNLATLRHAPLQVRIRVSEIISNPKLLPGRQNRSGLRRSLSHSIGCWLSCRARRGYAIPTLDVGRNAASLLTLQQFSPRTPGFPLPFCSAAAHPNLAFRQFSCLVSYELNSGQRAHKVHKLFNDSIPALKSGSFRWARDPRRLSTDLPASLGRTTGGSSHSPTTRRSAGHGGEGVVTADEELSGVPPPPESQKKRGPSPPPTPHSNHAPSGGLLPLAVSIKGRPGERPPHHHPAPSPDYYAKSFCVEVDFKHLLFSPAPVIGQQLSVHAPFNCEPVISRKESLVIKNAGLKQLAFFSAHVPAKWRHLPAKFRDASRQSAPGQAQPTGNPSQYARLWRQRRGKLARQHGSLARSPSSSGELLRCQISPDSFAAVRFENSRGLVPTLAIAVEQREKRGIMCLFPPAYWRDPPRRTELANHERLYDGKLIIRLRVARPCGPIKMCLGGDVLCEHHNVACCSDLPLNTLRPAEMLLVLKKNKKVQGWVFNLAYVAIVTIRLRAQVCVPDNTAQYRVFAVSELLRIDSDVVLAGRGPASFRHRGSPAPRHALPEYVDGPLLLNVRGHIKSMVYTTPFDTRDELITPEIFAHVRRYAEPSAGKAGVCVFKGRTVCRGGVLPKNITIQIRLNRVVWSQVGWPARLGGVVITVTLRVQTWKRSVGIRPATRTTDREVKRTTASSGIDSHLRKSGDPAGGLDRGSPWWEASMLIAQPKNPAVCEVCTGFAGLDENLAGTQAGCPLRHLPMTPRHRAASINGARNVNIGQRNGTSLCSPVSPASIFIRMMVAAGSVAVVDDLTLTCERHTSRTPGVMVQGAISSYHPAGSTICGPPFLGLPALQIYPLLTTYGIRWNDVCTTVNDLPKHWLIYTRSCRKQLVACARGHYPPPPTCAMECIVTSLPVELRNKALPRIKRVLCGC
ncbi:hypothetical protein PR048_022267 [Dryococelus australis]|uniref:Uncharacterized protein n=1 Tax=Dryococelus australis TaxID=614101 RepID=A0ABQ9H0K7_9NEOP|nr:hypothetical protein PR048_022267 [Dryococelus australis]